MGKALLTVRLRRPEDRPVRNVVAGGVRVGAHSAQEDFPEEGTSEQILEQMLTFPLLWMVEYVSFGFFFLRTCIS